MIHTSRTVTVGKTESIINEPIVLYRGDREVEVEFAIVGSKFTFTNGGNVIKSTNATHGQLVVDTPTGENMFSEVTECHEGKVVFTITKEMIDELAEVGLYSFQIRLFDESQVSRVTIPPVYQGIEIRHPMAAEDETDLVDIGLVDYSVVRKNDYENVATFLPNGDYNKTNWEEHDVISRDRLNKVEDALYEINKGTEGLYPTFQNQYDEFSAKVNKDVKVYKEEMEDEVEQFERDMTQAFGEFKVDYKDEVHDRLDEVSEGLEVVNSQLAQNDINIKNLLKNGLVLPSGGDDTQVIQNMLDTNKKVTLIKGVYNISSLTIPSGGQIIGTKNTTIKASGEKAFYFPKNTGNLSFKNFTIQTSNSVYCFYFDGELGSVITDGVIEDVKIVGFITPVYAKYLRKFNFNRISSHCKNFMEYTGKSAEVNINNSYLVHYFDINEDSFGIKSYAEGEYYPEGLMINNTLIYHFERNFDITDLMVGNFTNIHSDSSGNYCLSNRITFNKLTQTIMFDTCWFYSSKFEIGNDNETTGKTYRMNIKNCCFEACEDGITIKLNKGVSDVSISNCRFARSADASDCIGIVCVDGNNQINIHDLDFYSFISYIQFKGYGLGNSISNIPNNDNLETPFYLAYPVTTNNVFCKFKSYYINQGFNVTSDSEIINKELNLGEGVYVCKVKMNQLNISTEGFVALIITGDNVYKSSGAGWSSSYSYIRNKEFETSFYFNISNPCKVNVTFKSEGAVFTVGYHSYMEIIKL